MNGNISFLLLYIKRLLNCVRMFCLSVSYCTGLRAEIGQMTSLLLKVNKCIKRESKNKLLSKFVLTLVFDELWSTRLGLELTLLIENSGSLSNC